MAPGRASERRRAETRREIIDAAWALCRERGVAGLSLRELAERVGMRAPSLYSYFASKDAIFDALFADGHRDLAAHMAFLPDHGVTRADLRAGARAFFQFCTSDPARYQLLFQRTIPGFVPSEESYGLAIAQMEQMGRQFGSLGIVEPRHLDLWTALISGLIDQQLANDPGGDRWARLLDEAVDLFCDHVGVPADADAANTTTNRRRP